MSHCITLNNSINILMHIISYFSFLFFLLFSRIFLLLIFCLLFLFFSKKKTNKIVQTRVCTNWIKMSKKMAKICFISFWLVFITMNAKVFYFNEFAYQQPIIIFFSSVPINLMDFQFSFRFFIWNCNWKVNHHSVWSIIFYKCLIFVFIPFFLFASILN